MPLLRFTENLGTSGDDTIVAPLATGQLGTVYFGLRGNDTFTTSSDPNISNPQLAAPDPIFVGGRGSDTYTVVPNSEVIIVDNSGAAGTTDTVVATGINFSTATMFLIDGRYLVVGDLNSHESFVLPDYTSAANQIESFVFGDGTFTQVQFQNKVQLVAANYTWAQIQPFGTVYSAADFSEAISYYTARDLALENHAPVITSTNTGVGVNTTVAATTLFNVTDADGDAMTLYRFWDPVGGGHFTVNGIAQAEGANIDVAGSNIANVNYVGGPVTGSETEWLQVSDGTVLTGWTSWTQSTIRLTNTLPVVSAPDKNLTQGQWVLASTLFTVSDADGDAMTQYQFQDNTTTGGSAQLWTSAVGYTNSATVTAANLSTVWIQGGANLGTDSMQVQANDGYGWSNTAVFNVSTRLPNRAPVVTSTNTGVAVNTPVLASTLFNVTDADGDTVTQYQLWDGGAGGGYFTVNGVTQGTNTAITVNAVDMANTYYVGGAVTGSETLWAQAYDGTAWSGWGSGWTENTIRLTNTLPVVSAPDKNLTQGQWVLASTLFTVSDADGDAMTQYQFQDNTTTGGSAQLWTSAVGYTNSATVTAANLSTVWIQGGANLGTDSMQVQANDGYGWSNTAVFNVSTRLPNRAPVVTSTNTGVAVNTPVLASTLFNVTDADGDTVTQYQLWDGGAGGGYFTVNGVTQGTNTAITVNAVDMANTYYVGGAVTGSETLWAQAYDGTAWSGWGSGWTENTIRLTNTLPVVSAPDKNLTQGQWVLASTLFTVSDADGDAMTQYQFQDNTTTGGSAQLWTSAVGYTNSATVTAANLSTVWIQGGANLGTDSMQVQANDGYGWSNVATFNVNTRLPNRAPVVTSVGGAMQTNTPVLASTLFNITDADGDAITQYHFWDYGAGGGHFTVNGVIQNPSTIISVSAADFANTYYVGGSAPGSEKISVQAFDGTAWSAWVDGVAVYPPLRFPEVIGTTGDDMINGLTDTVYFGLQGIDRFTANGQDPIFMGGSGGDYYTASPNSTVMVYENGNSANDVLNALGLADGVDASGNHVFGAALVDGRHLLLQDLAGLQENILIIDWQQPANRIETFNFGPTISYTYSELSNLLQTLPNITWEQVGFDTASINESLNFYAQQAAVLESDALPVVTPIKANWMLRYTDNVAASSLFTVSDADGDAITKYEFTTDSGSHSGYFALNGVQQADGTFTVTTAQLAQLLYVGASASSSPLDDAKNVTVRAYDGLQWGAATTWVMTTVGNRAPTISGLPNSGSSSDSKILVPADQSVPLAAYFRVDDADGDPITQYQFQDVYGPNLTLDGVPQPMGQWFTVSAADLYKVRFTQGSQSNVDYIQVQAYDGRDWGMNGFFVSSPANSDLYPVVSAHDVRIAPGQSIAATSLFTAFDPDGDPIQSYDFKNYSYTDPNAPLVEVNGVVQGTGFDTVVSAADIGQVTFVGGAANNGQSLIYVGVTAGGATEYQSAYVVTKTNLAPVITSSETTVNPGQAVAASSLFSVVDPEGDPVTSYSFTDLGNQPGSGYFTLDGIPWVSNTTLNLSQTWDSNNILVLPNLSRVQYVGGSVPGIESVSISVNDGQGPDVTTSLHIATAGVIPDAAGNSLGTARNVSLSQSTSSFADLVGATDTDDYYKFTLPSDATLQAYLSGMTENADLRLLDSGGAPVPGGANKLGATPEILQQPLAAGTYYIQITAVGGAQTNYNLTMNLA